MILPGCALDKIPQTITVKDFHRLGKRASTLYSELDLGFALKTLLNRKRRRIQFHGGHKTVASVLGSGTARGSLR